MKKLSLALVCCAALALLAGGCQGKQASDGKAKTYRIGISKITVHPALDACEQGIQDQLKARGVSADFDIQSANGDPNTAAQIANVFKSNKVDIAVGITTPSAQALVNAIGDIPIVFTAVTDPVAAGLVASNANGGGNVAGVSDAIPTLEHIAIFKEITGIQTLGYIYNSSEANSIAAMELVEEACRRENITLVTQAVTNTAEVRQAAQSIVNRVDGIYMTTDNVVFAAVSAVIEVFGGGNKPIFAGDVTGIRDGGCLVGSGVNYYKAGIAAGDIIADIIGGKKPGDIPVKFLTEPSEVEFFFDLDVAKKLGISIPEKYLSLANLIFENGTLTEK